ncbi:MAG: YbaB/EbfC family nucleoid-associated protein [Nocardioidaceae bacterium]
MRRSLEQPARVDPAKIKEGTVTEGGMPDMSALLAQAQQMQQQLLAAKDDLAATHVTGTAANGLVTATVTGTGELVGLDIKPEAVDPDDVETLADMVVAAVRDATDNASQLASERMGPLAGGLGDLGL